MVGKADRDHRETLVFFTQGIGMLSEEMPVDYTGVSRRERGSSRTDKLSGLKRLQSSPRDPVGYRVVLILFWSYIIT